MSELFVGGWVNGGVLAETEWYEIPCIIVFSIGIIILMILFVIGITESQDADAKRKEKFMRTCPACHDREVAKTATACPNCGHVFKRSR